MTQFIVAHDIEREEFAILCERWDRSPNASMDISFSNQEDLHRLALTAINFLPRAFAEMLLGDLAEIGITSPETLEIIFRFGGTGCREVVCLRNDLTDQQKLACEAARMLHRSGKHV